MIRKWSLPFRAVIIFLVLFSLEGIFFLYPTELDSAPLTDAKDTLSTSRLSFSTALEGAHNTGDTTIKIDTSNYPDTNTNHLFPGDTVHIGSNDYTVGTIVDSSTFTITSGLQSGDTADDTAVYVAQEATHTIAFTTASAVTNGAVRVSIKSASSGYNDGKPDATGFDFNSITGSDVTCPTGGGVTSWESATATAAANWHTFECRYNGTLSASQSLTMTIGGTNKLINPAPESGHTQGTGDDYTVKIEVLNNNYDVIDNVNVKTVVIEAVRVTATVEPTLSLTIAAGTADSGTICGVTRDASSIDTTVYSVPFGSITSSDTFYNAYQQLTVSTNADDGYVVTAEENDQLGLGGATSPNIPDTTGDNGTATESTSDEWTTASNNGFGYSLENASGTDAAFTYNESSRTFSAKQFADMAGSETKQTIMSNSGPVSGSSIYVCYRLSVSGTQTAGDYWNTITYIATPQF